jgi:hypothetical protein
MIYGVLKRVLQQGVEEGEVRDYPTERKESAWVEDEERKEGVRLHGR